MIAIRQIAAGDAAEVSGLVTQLGYQRNAAQVGAWIDRLDPSRQIAFVAVSAGEIAGWIEAEAVHHLQTAPFVLIGGLVVKEGVRGQGVGRMLCQRAEAWTCSLGIETVRVTSRSTRLDAHRFYLRDGYRHDKTSLVFEKKCGENEQEA